MTQSAAMKSETTEIARPLKVLVPLIKDELERGNAAGLDHYRRAGEMLIEAREQVARGEWSAWLERNFHLSHRTALRYVALAETSNLRQRRFTPTTTLSSVVEPHREHHQPAWHRPVQQITDRVNVDKLAQERQARDAENKLTRDLALQLIDIGYKVLATKLHPDKGGSREAMARLNRVRDVMRREWD